MERKKALVLSGGSILGAFEAGAISYILQTGWAPDAIYGTSVGSLNGAFLTERAGRASAAGTLDWKAIGQDLESFWRTQLVRPSQVARKRSLVELIASIARQRFAGLVDTAALKRLIKQVLDQDYIRQSPVRFTACAVNVASGKALYATNDYSDILEYVIASTAIPIEMPTSIIGDAAYVDGGIREVAPLKRAIDEGALDIVSVVCQPEDMPGVGFKAGDFMPLVFRLMGIVVNELVNNDLLRLGKVNDRVEDYDLCKYNVLGTLTQAGVSPDVVAAVEQQLNQLFVAEWRHIRLRTIRPENDILLDLLTFTPDDIARVVNYGRHMAHVVWEQA